MSSPERSDASDVASDSEGGEHEEDRPRLTIPGASTHHSRFQAGNRLLAQSDVNPPSRLRQPPRYAVVGGSSSSDAPLPGEIFSGRDAPSDHDRRSSHDSVLDAFVTAAMPTQPPLTADGRACFCHTTPVTNVPRGASFGPRTDGEVLIGHFYWTSDFDSGSAGKIVRVPRAANRTGTRGSRVGGGATSSDEAICPTNEPISEQNENRSSSSKAAPQMQIPPVSTDPLCHDPWEYHVYVSPDCANTEYEGTCRTWFYWRMRAAVHINDTVRREVLHPVHLVIRNIQNQSKLYQQNYCVMTRGPGEAW